MLVPFCKAEVAVFFLPFNLPCIPSLTLPFSPLTPSLPRFLRAGAAAAPESELCQRRLRAPEQRAAAGGAAAPCPARTAPCPARTAPELRVVGQ